MRRDGAFSSSLLELGWRLLVARQILLILELAEELLDGHELAQRAGREDCLPRHGWKEEEALNDDVLDGGVVLADGRRPVNVALGALQLSLSSSAPLEAPSKGRRVWPLRLGDGCSGLRC